MHILPLSAEEIERRLLNIPDIRAEVAAEFVSVLRFIKQELSADQQAQARTNISAAAISDITLLDEELSGDIDDLGKAIDIVRDTLSAGVAENAQHLTTVESCIFNINYDETLKFDTSELVIGDATSPILGVGMLGHLVLA